MAGFLLGAVAMLPVSAAGISEGRVSEPLATTDAKFMFTAGEPTGRPGCATQALSTWVVDLTTEGGRSVRTLVLSAYALQRSVRVMGKGVCDIKADRESVEFVYIVG